MRRFLVRSEEALSVEMDHVLRGLGDPDLGLPCDIADVFDKAAPIQEGRDENKARFTVSEQGFQLGQALRADWAMARDGLDQDEPVLLDEVNDQVGHLPVLFEDDAEIAEVFGIEECPLLSRVADVDGPGSRSEARAELIDDLLDQFVLPSRRQPDCLASTEGEGDAAHLTRLGVTLGESLNAGQVLAEEWLPFERTKGAEQFQSGRLDLIAEQGAVLGPRRFIRIGDDQAGLLELMQGEPAHGFPGIGLPDLLVVLGNELHDGRHAAEGLARLMPGFLRRQIDQAEQSERGSFVMLFFGQAEVVKCLLGLCDASFQIACLHRA